MKTNTHFQWELGRLFHFICWKSKSTRFFQRPSGVYLCFQRRSSQPKIHGRSKGSLNCRIAFECINAFFWRDHCFHHSQRGLLTPQKIKNKLYNPFLLSKHQLQKVVYSHALRERKLYKSRALYKCKCYSFPII